MWWRAPALYLAAAALSLALAGFFLRLRHADLRVPLDLPGDGIYYGLLVKTLIETGWVHHNPSLGAPFGLDLYDFPHFDNLQLGLMKVLTLFSSDWAVVLNLYYLLTYPLTALTALLLLRALRLHPALALAFSLLYALQPYHFLRGQGHIMLASYYQVPLLVLLCFWLADRRGLRSPEGRLLGSGRLWVAVVVCLAAASAGHYYASFGCLFFLVSGATASLLYRRWRNLRHAALLGAAVAAGFAANLLPNALYWAREGANRGCSAKEAHFSEVYGLKVVQLLLPIPNHRLGAFRTLTQRYLDTSPAVNENISSGVGAVAGLGFVVLLALAFLPRWREPAASPLPLLSRLNLAAVLLATVGGFGTLFAYLVSPQLHGFNRISICIALFGLVAVAWLVDRAVARLRRPGARHAAAVAAAGLLLLAGLYDQTTWAFVPAYAANEAEFARQEAFGRAVEQAVPPGTPVFQLPLSSFPFDDGRIGYDHFHLYLHTRGLRWSDPAMLNRRSAYWQRRVAAQPPERMLESLAAAGFGGLLLDLKTNRPRERDLLRRVGELTGARPVHDGGSRYFFSLRAYAESLKARYGPAGWQRLVGRALCPVWVFWGPQFYEAEVGTGESVCAWHCCRGPRGEFQLVNPSDRPVRVSLSLTLAPSGPAPTDLALAGPLSGDRHLGPAGGKVAEVLTVPPGRHPFVVTAPGLPALPRGADYFHVEGLSVELVESAGAE